MEGNLHFKIDWASLIAGNKSTIFALFYHIFEGNFPSTSPRWAYIWRGELTEGFLHRWFGGLIFGGAYFRNFVVIMFFTGSISTAEGSALVKLGNATVVCGVKAVSHQHSDL